MKIINYIGFIEEQYRTLTKVYSLKSKLKNYYSFILENEYVEIFYFSEYRSDNGGIGFGITNKKRMNSYDVFEKERNIDFITPEQRAYLDSIQDMVERFIFISRILIEKYCLDALEGDFSSLGDGKPLI